MSDMKPAAGVGQNTKVMNRFDLTKRLVGKLRNEEAVVGGIGNNNFDLWAAGQRPQNFYMLASMGLAGPIALGVAIAQPQRRVFAIEGDGSLLMQLGFLATVARQGQKNFSMILMDNAVYQSTGSQRTATAFGADLVAIAQGCGIAQSSWAADEGEFEQLVERSLTEDGPWFIAARIDATKAVGTTERDAPLIRDRFMRGLGVKK